MYLEGIFSGSAEDIASCGDKQVHVHQIWVFGFDEESLQVTYGAEHSSVQRSLKRARTLPDSRSTGITAIFLNGESTVITGVASKEGEEVMFVNPVSTAEFIQMANAKFQHGFEQDKSWFKIHSMTGKDWF